MSAAPLSRPEISIPTAQEKGDEPYTPLSASSTYTAMEPATPLPDVVGEYTITKAEEEFRNYKDSKRQAIVENHYRLMRTNQTFDFVRRMKEKFSFDKPRARMTVREAFRVLENYVDSSDPDASMPNFIHMLQSAESARKAGEPDWMQLILLIHDIGKILFIFNQDAAKEGMEGTATGEQWALGGDTWVVGCRIPDCTVFPEFNTLNPDSHDERYNTELGVYEVGCGLDNLLYAYGHDEYAHDWLVANKARLPPEAFAMVRLHSLYPWHKGGAYRHLMAPGDEAKLAAVLRFNVYDLYSKSDDNVLDADALWPYYQSLIDKYLGPEPLIW